MGAGVDAWMYTSHMCREYCSLWRQSPQGLGLVSWAYYRTIARPHIMAAHSTLRPQIPVTMPSTESILVFKLQRGLEEMIIEFISHLNLKKHLI